MSTIVGCLVTGIVCGGVGVLAGTWMAVRFIGKVNRSLGLPPGDDFRHYSDPTVQQKQQPDMLVAGRIPPMGDIVAAQENASSRRLGEDS